MFSFCLEEQAEPTDIAIAVSETSINKKYFDSLYIYVWTHLYMKTNVIAFPFSSALLRNTSPAPLPSPL